MTSSRVIDVQEFIDTHPLSPTQTPAPRAVLPGRGHRRIRHRHRRLHRAGNPGRMAARRDPARPAVRGRTVWLDDWLVRRRTSRGSLRPEDDADRVGPGLRWLQRRVGIQSGHLDADRAPFPHRPRARRRHADGHHADVRVLPETPAVVARDVDVLRLHDRLRDRRHRGRAGRHRIRLAPLAHRRRPDAGPAGASARARASRVGSLPRLERRRRNPRRSRPPACGPGSCARRRSIRGSECPATFAGARAVRRRPSPGHAAPLARVLHEPAGRISPLELDADADSAVRHLAQPCLVRSRPRSRSVAPSARSSSAD